MIFNNVGLFTSSLSIIWPGAIAEIVLSSTDGSHKLTPGPEDTKRNDEWQMAMLGRGEVEGENRVE